MLCLLVSQTPLVIGQRVLTRRALPRVWGMWMGHSTSSADASLSSPPPPLTKASSVQHRATRSATLKRAISDNIHFLIPSQRSLIVDNNYSRDVDYVTQCNGRRKEHKCLQSSRFSRFASVVRNWCDVLDSHHIDTSHLHAFQR